MEFAAYVRIYLFIAVGAVFLLAVRKAVTGRAAPWPASFDHSLGRLATAAGRRLKRFAGLSQTLALFPPALGLLRSRLAQLALLAVPFIIAAYGADQLGDLAAQWADKAIFGLEGSRDYNPWTVYAARVALAIFVTLPPTLYFAVCTVLFVSPANTAAAVMTAIRRPVSLLGLILFLLTLKNGIVRSIYIYLLSPWPTMERPAEWFWQGVVYGLPAFFVYILCGVFMFAMPGYALYGRRGWTVSRAVFRRLGVRMLILLPIVVMVFHKATVILMRLIGWAVLNGRPPLGSPNREWFDTFLRYLNTVLEGAVDCLLIAILAALIAAAFLRERDELSAEGAAVPPRN